MIFFYINKPKARVSYNGITLAFQANDVSSILTTRSKILFKRKLCRMSSESFQLLKQLLFKESYYPDEPIPNKFGYDTLQSCLVHAWGGTLYLDYDTLPSGPGDKSQLLRHLEKDYVRAVEKDDQDEVMDLQEWLGEGAPIKIGSQRKYLLTKQLCDMIYTSCLKPLDEDLVIYKSGDGKSSGRWISVTINKGQYPDYGEEREYILSKGTKVIFTEGLCDDGELIINSSLLSG